MRASFQVQTFDDRLHDGRVDRRIVATLSALGSSSVVSVWRTRSTLKEALAAIVIRPPNHRDDEKVASMPGDDPCPRGSSALDFKEHSLHFRPCIAAPWYVCTIFQIALNYFFNKRTLPRMMTSVRARDLIQVNEIWTFSR